jgi:hypothetical protein
MEPQRCRAGDVTWCATAHVTLTPQGLEMIGSLSTDFMTQISTQSQEGEGSSGGVDNDGSARVAGRVLCVGQRHILEKKKGGGVCKPIPEALSSLLYYIPYCAFLLAMVYILAIGMFEQEKLTATVNVGLPQNRSKGPGKGATNSMNASRKRHPWIDMIARSRVTVTRLLYYPLLIKCTGVPPAHKCGSHSTLMFSTECTKEFLNSKEIELVKFRHIKYYFQWPFAKPAPELFKARVHRCH